MPGSRHPDEGHDSLPGSRLITAETVWDEPESADAWRPRGKRAPSAATGEVPRRSRSKGRGKGEHGRDYGRVRRKAATEGIRPPQQQLVAIPEGRGEPAWGEHQVFLLAQVLEFTGAGSRVHSGRGGAALKEKRRYHHRRARTAARSQREGDPPKIRNSPMNPDRPGSPTNKGSCTENSASNGSPCPEAAEIPPVAAVRRRYLQIPTRAKSSH